MKETDPIAGIGCKNTMTEQIMQKEKIAKVLQK